MLTGTQILILQEAQTAVLTSISCDTLLVAVTPCMTELAAGRVHTGRSCTQLVYYTDSATEQVNFHALLIAVTHLHNYTIPVY